jgi:hypothetical protein
MYAERNKFETVTHFCLIISKTVVLMAEMYQGEKYVIYFLLQLLY